ncbi:MAG: ABC transporter ATP-binding protein [Gammaproteobacteria bacterium]
MSAHENVLEVRDLVVEFSTERGAIRAVDGVSFTLAAGETLGIVGESGCGKTITCLALLGLVPAPAGKIISGEILVNGQNIVGCSDKQMRKIRGRDVAMIFQEPMTALNPVFTVRSQLVDVLKRQAGLTSAQSKDRALELLDMVGIPAPRTRLDDYPHQLSGGMRQRVMIAMALACSPKILVADEPTTALDVTTQAQVIEQIVKLQQQFDMGVVLVTHDLGVVAQMCENVMVMYCGEVVEAGTARQLFTAPAHPYTSGLLNSIPKIRKHRLERLPVIDGMVPDLAQLPTGCYFNERCSSKLDSCVSTHPELERLSQAHEVACLNPQSQSK